MSIEKEIQDAFKFLKGRGEITFSATVQSVDKAKGTCVVNDDDLEYTDVRLASVINDRENKLYVFPKPGSSVLVSTINGDLENLFVEAYSEVDEFLLKAGATEMTINASGYKIDRQGENLKTVLNDYIDEVNKIIVVQGTTINVGATNAIKQRLNKILI